MRLLPERPAPIVRVHQGREAFTLRSSAPEEAAGLARIGAPAFEARLGAQVASVELRREGAHSAVRVIPVEQATAPGELVGGRVVYRHDDGALTLLTPLAAGIKEDVVLPRARGDRVVLRWRLELGEDLEARAAPDGSIEVLGPQGVLWQEIPAGDEASRALLERARARAPRTTVLYRIPAPIIRDAHGKAPAGQARYELEQGTLRLVASGLVDLAYPISIDPSLVVTTTNDLRHNATGDGSAQVAGDRVSRAGPELGVGTWAASAALPSAQGAAGWVAHGGYVFLVGGTTGAGATASVYSAPIGPTGLGAWTATTSLPAARSGLACVAWNGHLYALGGKGAAVTAEVLRAPILPGGRLGSWSATTSLPAALHKLGAAVWRGTLYVAGGNNGSAPVSTVSSAPINPDGSVGAWTAGTALPAARAEAAVAAHNDQLYVLGGAGSAAAETTAYLAPIGTGTVGSWASLPSLPSARARAAAAVSGGVLYLTGGYDGTNYLSEVVAAALAPDGRVGDWLATQALSSVRGDHAAFAAEGRLFVAGGCSAGATCSTALSTSASAPLEHGNLGPWTVAADLLPGERQFHGAAFWNGYVYAAGGCSVSPACTTPATLATVVRAPLPPGGAIGAWSAATAMGVARWGHTLDVHDGFLYAVGGKNSAGAVVKTVERTAINPDGTLGTWVGTGMDLPQVRWRHASAVYNGYLYVVGGSNNSVQYNDIYYAAINADGTLGAWQSSANKFTTNRRSLAVVATHGRLYVLGGDSGSAPLADVQFAPINPNGSLGAWTSTTALPSARKSHTAFARDGFMYVLGGYAATFVQDGYYAPIRADGTLGAWTALPAFTQELAAHVTLLHGDRVYNVAGDTKNIVLRSTESSRLFAHGGHGAWAATTQIAGARQGQATLAYRGHLYVFGGHDGTQYLNDVQVAPINDDGSLGAFATTTAFSGPRQYMAVAAHGDHVFLLGGFDGSYLADVSSAPVNANGTLGAWTATTALPSARHGHAVAVVGDKLFLLGGRQAGATLNTVDFATLGANGTLGAWTSTAPFVQHRWRHATVSYGGRLYVIGGSDNADVDLASVETAAVNASGQISAWTTAAGLPVRLYRPIAGAANGFLYLAGGSRGSAASTQAWTAPIFSDGSLGTWVPGAQLTAGHERGSGALYRGHLYAVAGNSGGVHTRTVEHARLYTPDAAARYSRLIDLGGAVTSIDSVTLFGTASATGTLDLRYRTAGATGPWAVRTDVGPVTPGAAQTVGAPDARYLWVDVTLDDGQGAVINRDFSATRDLTELQVAYTGTAQPSKLAVTTAAQTVDVSACSGVVVVEAQDGASAARPVQVDTAVAASSDSGTLRFYSDAACSAEVSSAIVPAGGGSVSFYFKDSSAGTPRLTFSATNLASASQVQTVGSATPTRLAFTTPARTFTAGSCAGAAGVIAVELQDALGNPISAGPGGQPFTASSSSGGTVGWFTDATCSSAAGGGSFTIPAGSSSVAVYYRDTLVGTPSVSLTNASGLANPAPQAHTVVAGAEAKLAFTSPSRTFTAGSCPGATRVITVQLQDASGNPVSAPPGGRAFTAASTSTGTVSWFTDAACGSTATGGNFTIPAGASSTSVYYRDTVAGTPSVSLANGSGLANPAPQAHTVVAGTAARLAFTTPPRTFTAGTCGGAARVITVQLQDANGNPVSAGGGGQAFTAASTSTGTVGWFTSSTCGTAAPGGAFSIPAGSSTASLYYRDTLAGTPSISVSNGSGLANPAAQTHTVVAGPASSMGFTTPPRTFTAGACGGAANVITVQLEDAGGNPVNAGAGGEAFTASSTSSGSVAWFKDATCSTGAQGGVFTIAAGTSAVNVYYRDSAVGTPSISIMPADLTLGFPMPQAHSVVAGTGARLAFTTPSRTFTAGSCPGAANVVTVQLQDASGNPVNAGPGGQALTASSSSAGTVSWFTDASCGSAAPGGSFTIPAGSSSVALYHRDTLAGTPSLSLANGSGLSNPTPQAHTVIAGAAARLAFTSPARTFTAGACPGAANVIVVQLQDASGNPVNAGAGGQAFTATTTSTGTVSWFGDSACATPAPGGAFTLAAGTSSTSVYYRDTLAGTPSVGLSNASGLANPTAQLHTVVAGPAARLAFTSPPRTFTAGACAGAANAIVVQLQDGGGNPVVAGPGGVAITATSSSAGTVSWFSDAACAAPAAGGAFSIPAGASSTSLYYRDTLAGTPGISLGNGAGLANPSAQTHTVVAGTAARLAFTTPSRTFTAGSCPGAANVVGVQLQDASGNPVSAGPGGVAFTAASTSTGTVSWFSDGACGTAAAGGAFTIPAGASFANLYYRDTRAGAISLSLGNGAGLANPAAQPHTVVAGSAARLAFTTPSRTFTAGSCAGAANAITVQLQDAQGNPVTAGAGGQAFTAASTSSGTVGWFTDAACGAAAAGGDFTIAAGTSSVAVYYRDSLAGSPSLGLSNSSGLANPTAQTHTVVAGAAARLAFTTPVRGFTAGACPGATRVITVQLQDASGNPVNASVGGMAFTATSSSTGTVSWFTDAACGSAATGGNFTIPAGSSSVSVYYRDTLAGAPSVGLANGSGLSNPAAQVHTVSAGPAAKLAFTTPSRTFTAGVCGGAANVITVQLRDAYDNPVSAGAGGAALTASSSSAGTVGWFRDAGCATGAPGGSFTIAAGSSSVGLYYRDTQAGTPSISVTSATLGFPLPQVHTVVAAAAGRLAFTTGSRTFTAGSCPGGANVITVQLQDGIGNPTPAGAGGQAFTASSTSAGTVTWFTDAACGAVASGGSFSIPAGASSVSVYYRDTLAGTPSLSLANGSGLLTPPPQVHTVVAGAPARLAFATPGRTFTAGSCAGAGNVITVALQDAHGNAANAGAGGVPFTAASSSTGTVSWFTDASCGASAPGGTFTLPAGSSSVGVYYRDTLAGTPSLSLSNAAGLANPAPQAHTVIAGSAARLAFTTPSRTFTAGACAGSGNVITVRLEDASGNPVSAGAGGQPFTLASTSGGTVRWYSDPACSNLVAGGGFTIAAGSQSAAVYYLDTLAGTPTLSVANGAGLANPAPQVHTVVAGAAARLAFLTPSRTFTAGACAGAAKAITVQLQDAGGNAVNAGGAGLTVRAASSSTGTVGWFSDSTCATAAPGGAFTLPAGTSTVSIFYRDTLAGTPSISVSNSSGLSDPAAQVHAVVAGAAARLAFTTPSRTFTAGACAGAAAVVTVELQDGSGNPVSAGPGGQALTASSSSTGTVAWFTDASCSAPAAGGGFTIPAGASSAGLYYRDSQVGTPSISLANAAGLANPAAQPHTVVAGAAARLAFVTPARTFTAGACAGAGNVITVQLQDGNGNPVSAGAGGQGFTASSSSGGTVAWFTDAACGSAASAGSFTIAAGTSSVALYYRDTLAGTPSLSVTSSTGLASPPAQVHTVVAGSAARLAFTTPARTFTAGGCPGAGNVVTVQLQDASGNAVSAGAGGQEVVLSSSSGGTVSWFADAACGSLVPGGSYTIPAGTSSVAVYYRDTLAGTPSLSAGNSAGLANPLPQLHTVVAGAASRLAFTTPSRTFTAGTCAGAANAITVQLQDVNGNAVSAGAGGQDLVASSTSTGTVSWFTDAACGTAAPGGTFTLPPGASAANLYYRDTRAGTPTVSLANSAGLANPAGQPHSVVPGAAAQLAFRVQPGNTQAGAAIAPAIEVAVQDALGNALTTSGTDVTVSLANNPTGATLAGPQVMATTSGVATFSALSLTAAGAGYTLSASAQGLPAVTSASFDVLPAAAARLAFTGQPVNTPAGAVIAPPVEVSVQDAFGNPVSAPASISLAIGTNPAGGTLAGTTTIATSTGRASFATLAIDAAGSGYSLLASSNGLADAISASFDVLPGAVSALAFTTPPQTVVAGACSGVVTAELRDAQGNPTVAAAPTQVSLGSTSPAMTFFSDATCATQLTSRTVPAGSGTASFHFRSTLAGSTAVTATVGAIPPANQAATITADVPAQLQFISAAPAFGAGTCHGPVVVEARDTWGNTAPLTAAATVLLSSTSPGGAWFSDSGCQMASSAPTLQAGTASITAWLRDTVAGSWTLTAASNGFGSGTQAATVSAAAAAALQLSNFPSPSPSGASGQFTLTARDTWGNVATGFSSTVGFTSSDPAAQLPAPYTFLAADSGTRTFSATLFTVGTQSLTATDAANPALTATQQNIQVTAGAPAALVLSGITSPVAATALLDVTVEVRDGAGNRVTDYAGTVRFSSTDPLASLPADYTFVAADQGRHLFATAVAFATPGTQTLTAADVLFPAVTGTLPGLEVLQQQGGGCTSDTQCGTGTCQQGVCCDRACTGPCEACNLDASPGTCAPVPNGASCADATYCDGAETCQGGSCTAAAPVACTDPTGETALVCDEQQRACVPAPDAPPVIVEDALLTAGLNVPYRYNAVGHIRAAGTWPMSFAACGAPAGFRVDPASGAVSWPSPDPVGAATVCVQATNAFGTDTYTYTLDVQQPQGAGPVAILQLSPEAGTAPLAVSHDGRASTADPSTSVAGWRWDFGDGAPFATGSTAAHDYVLPGGYRPELQVTDGVGRTGAAKAAVGVARGALRPPAARIVASATGGDGSLAVDFTCDCQPGDAAISALHWDFGDGAQSGEWVTHTFAPGRYRVYLTVVDANGLTAVDSVEVAVTQAGAVPPQCRLFAAPPAGAAPLATELRAVFHDEDGTIASHRLTLADGSTSEAVRLPQSLATPAAALARLQVRDDQGLGCVDRVVLVALGQDGQEPPRILSVPSAEASCGVPWSYGGEGGLPAAAGTGPFRWTALAAGGDAVPAGLEVDEATGRVEWIPGSEAAGPAQFVLRVENAAGFDEQRIRVDVRCGEPVTLAVGCGCGSAAGLIPWAALAALAVGLRRRRGNSSSLR